MGFGDNAVLRLDVIGKRDRTCAGTFLVDWNGAVETGEGRDVEANRAMSILLLQDGEV